MQTFIRVIEVWTPNESGQYLEFNSGIYGQLDEFAESSKQETFSLGEGLPGQAWKKARPVVLKEFDERTFLRTEAAHKVGLTSGVAIPIFAEQQLKAVVVFLCGDHEKLAGAIEVWCDDGLSGLALVDGYYGDLERFEWLSKQIRFPRGRGLPGLAWETNQAKILGNLNASNSFLRSRAADDAGITTGIAIPLDNNEVVDAAEIGSVVTFLSSKSTPIAKRFEVWSVHENGECLYFDAGIIQDKLAVEETDTKICIKKGQGIIGQSWQNGLPEIASDLSKESLPETIANQVDNYGSLLTIPIYQQSELRSIVALYQ